MSPEKTKKVVPKRLPREAYHALENIVGKEWISDDRSTIECYLIHTIDPGAALSVVNKSATSRFAAVILPSSTEEVQGIIRVANRYGIRVSPFANGQMNSRPTQAGMLAISLKRMDKCRVDADDMSITIQPWVTYGVIHHEAAKKGLYLGGSGWHGAIAKPCSQFTAAGLWQSDLKYSGMSRNAIGMKVVLSNGSLLRLGSSASAGAGDTPFTERLPGPNPMGFMKGSFGSRGIITELTLKLHPWVGGAVPEDRSRPSIEHYFEEARENKFDHPPNFARHKLLWFEYPTLKAMELGMLRLARSGVGIALNGTGEYNAMMCTPTIDIANEWSKGHFHCMGYITIVGISSERQLQYEEKVVQHVVEETGGKILSSEYKPDLLEEQANWNVEFVLNTETGMRTVRSGYMIGVFPSSAPFSQITDGAAMWDVVAKEVAAVGEDRGEHFSSMPAKCPYIYVMDRGHQLYIEADEFPERDSSSELMAFLKAMIYGWWQYLASGKYAQSMAIDPGEPLISISPEAGPNNYKVLRMVKEVIDPAAIFVPGRVEYTAEQFKAAFAQPGPLLKIMLDMREQLGMPRLELAPDGESWKPTEPGKSK